MGTYNDAFKRAITEGSDTENVFPWQHTVSSGKELPPEAHPRKKPGEPAFLRHLPPEILKEYRITLEKIRSRIKGKPVQIIGMTSAVPHQGVTTSVAVLTALFARERSLSLRPDEANRTQGLSHAPVLLIDTCFSQAALHKTFQVRMKLGLSDLLAAPDVAVDDTMYESGIHDLHLLPAGHLNDFQLTQGLLGRFQQQLMYLRRQYAYIFIDVPPVVHEADGLAICKLCDAVIMVVKAGQTRYEIVQEAKRMLDSADVPIAGHILNQREFFVPRWLYSKL